MYQPFQESAISMSIHYYNFISNYNVFFARKTTCTSNVTYNLGGVRIVILARVRNGHRISSMRRPTGRKKGDGIKRHENCGRYLCGDSKLLRKNLKSWMKKLLWSTGFENNFLRTASDEVMTQNLESIMQLVSKISFYRWWQHHLVVAMSRWGGQCLKSRLHRRVTLRHVLTCVDTNSLSR